MKKVLFAVIALVAMVCTSCTKTETKAYYSYSNSMGIHGTGNDITELMRVVEPKLNSSIMQMTKAEATAEWNSFMSSVSNVSVTLNDESFYTIKLNRVEDKNGQFVAVETIGEKTWGTKPAE